MSEENQKKQKINNKDMEHRKLILETVTDCEFLVGQEPNQQSFKLARLPLALHSPVFHASLFEHAPPDLNEKPIVIPDITAKAFETLIHHSYKLDTNVIEHLTTVSEAIDLLYAVRKYLVDELEAPLVKHLSKKVDVSSVFAILKAADQLDILCLQQNCLDFISENAVICLHMPEFNDISINLLYLLLKQKRYCPEIMMLEALEKYALMNQLERGKTITLKGKSTPETLMLVDFLREIHFLIISPEEFAKYCQTSKMLTIDEMFSILVSMNYPSGTSHPLPAFISEEEKELSQFILMAVKKMIEMFDKAGKGFHFCNCCEYSHRLDGMFWSCEVFDWLISQDELDKLVEIIKKAKIWLDLETAASKGFSAIMRGIGEFMKANDLPLEVFDVHRGFWD